MTAKIMTDGEDANIHTSDTAASESALNDLLCCPYCRNEAEYFEGTNGQADAIYCKECPLGVEQSGMSYTALALVWNGLPRT